MVNNRVRVIKRVRKLLNLGNDPKAFEGEIRNAVTAAMQIMDEHHITKEDLETTEGRGVAEERFIRHMTWGKASKLANWEAGLMTVVPIKGKLRAALI